MGLGEYIGCVIVAIHRYGCLTILSFLCQISFANAELANLDFDVITIDGDVDRATARQVIGDNVALQGNYDPRELIEDGTKTPETVDSFIKINDKVSLEMKKQT